MKFIIATLALVATAFAQSRPLATPEQVHEITSPSSRVPAASGNGTAAIAAMGVPPSGWGRETKTPGRGSPLWAGHGRAHALGQHHPVILQMPAGKGFTWCYEENRYL